LISLSAFDDGEFVGIITQKVKVLINRTDLKVSIVDRQGKMICEDEAGFHWQHYLWKGERLFTAPRKFKKAKCSMAWAINPARFNCAVSD
jgi:alpha-glucosidase